MRHSQPLLHNNSEGDMTIEPATLAELERTATVLRKLTVNTTFWAGSAHIGGALSAMDLLTYLYFRGMNYSREDPEWPDRDRFLLSKGHCAVGHVAVLAELGWIPKEDLKTFNLTGSYLGMHLDSAKVRGVEASTGSLGHGLSIALGMALAARHQDMRWLTYCLLGDGECNEGSVWEAAMAIAHYRANNLITIVDRNKCMIDGPTEDVMALEPLDEKFAAFGFEVRRIDGHDFLAIDAALSEARANAEHKTGKPFAIIADTVKAEGVDFMAGDYRWHYGAIDQAMNDRCQTALDEHGVRRLAAVAGREGA